MDGDILHHGQPWNRPDVTGAVFGPATLAQLVSITVQPAAHARGLDFVVTVRPDTPARLVGNVAALGSLLNALSLAAVTTATSGRLTLTLSVDTSDGGPAILRAVLDGHFGDSAGFALGLAQRLIAGTGGTLSVEAAPEGGHRAVLGMPVGTAVQPTDAERLMGWARSRGGRLLVVDDSATNRMVTGGLLSKAGFSVEMATGGAEAVSAVVQATVPPEAVLMDVAMPDVDGIAATTTIRSLSGERGRIPIIAVTANAQADDRSRCLAAGMNDYVVKPVRRADLLAALERWLAPLA